jgi:hypothetical protein
MLNKLFGFILILVALAVAFDTSMDIWRKGFSSSDVLIMLVAIFIAIRGILRFFKAQ